MHVMAGRTPAERDSLARQNAALMAVFERAGFEQIAPDIIQPADIFLERSGEDIRARTFVFNDARAFFDWPGGEYAAAVDRGVADFDQF